VTPGHPLPAGTVQPIARRLPVAPDPLALYHALSDGGTTPHTFLLESADRATRTGDRSLIGAGQALRIVADRDSATVFPLSPNGRAAVAWLAQSGEQRGDGSEAGGAESDPSGSYTVPYPRRPAGTVDERTRFRQPSPLDLLRRLAFEPRLLTRPNPYCHLLAGVLGYDLLDYFETLPVGRPDPLDQPVLEFWLPDQLVVIDHVRRSTTLVTTAWGGPGSERRYHDATQALDRLIRQVTDLPEGPPFAPDPGPGGLPLALELDQDDEQYADQVRRLKREIEAGEVYQIVPSRCFSHPCPDPLGSYGRLRARNPSPYLFYFRSPERTLFGASPETCLRVESGNRRVSILPIAGTAPRGRRPDGALDPDQETRNEVALRLDAKEAAEHLMLVDLARNDVARVSVPGTRTVTRLLEIERYAHVIHLGSEVSGTLAPGIDSLEAYAATMPMGTLVGAPKVRAAELLREHEPSRRGCYGGAVGYLLDDGTLETAIVIRSALVQDGVAYVRAGAGVVLDSVPENEALETARKARAVLEAVALEGPVHA
jgi:anthranilate synthase component 1